MLAAYNKAFRYNGSSFPMTLPSAALTGMFELIDQFEIDWKRLLHTYQCFEYFEKFEVGMELHCQCALVKYRHRAGAHWLDFETELKKLGSESVAGKAQSRIMVEA